MLEYKEKQGCIVMLESLRVDTTCVLFGSIASICRETP